MKKQLIVGIIVLFSSCTQEDLLVSVDTSVSQPNMHIYIDDTESHTRCDAKDDIGRLSYTFRQHDHAISFSVKDNYCQSFLTYSEVDNSFNGFHVNSQADEIALLFPSINNPVVTADGRLLLCVPSQNGSLETLSNNSYQWGFATIAEDNGEYIGHTDLSDLMAICRFSFSCGGIPIGDIAKVEFSSSKGAFYENRYLNISSGSFEEGQLTHQMSIQNAEGLDYVMYVSFFPSSFALHICVTDAQGRTYEGDVPQNRYGAGLVNYIDVECQQTSEAITSSDDYIEVCGVQWAKGNLYYDTMAFGTSDFAEHYQLSSSQWYYPELCGESNTRSSHFNWGACGSNAASTSIYARYRGDLSGKMYSDVTCTKPTTNIDDALFGDLAYWTSHGSWRLPTKEEMFKLFSEASYSRGYYQTSAGEKIYGYLFWNTVGEREQSIKLKRFSDEDLSGKLFLPNAGLREAKSTAMTYLGSRGYYWHGECDDNMNQLMLGTSGLVWRSTGAAYGRTIRPVKCGESTVEQPEMEYIELLGVKWAKGNLQYGTYGGTADGFQPNWSLSENQWRFIDAGVGYSNHTTQQDQSCIYHFNWGVCGQNAASQNLYAKCYQDIAGCMFEDQACTHSTTDFSSALYGDIAYWASNGKYRLPTEAEMYRLYSEASYSRGCYVAADGSKTYGFLFREPVNGQRVIETKVQTYTDYELENYLFLPSAGNRQAKSSEILRVGYNGYYWHSVRSAEMYQFRMGGQEVIWAVTSPSYGRTVRPVLND